VLNLTPRDKNEIPIFFSTDDNYIPYLDIAIASLIENASKEYKYRIIVLNTGIEQENADKIMRNERDGFAIEFVNISAEVEKIKKSLKEPTNPKYIEKFIIECNKGVVTHRLSYPIGFLAMLTVDGLCTFTIALPIAVVNIFLNVLPTLVLRYNTPLLQKLLSLMNKKAALATE
jgi:hypothetical protein